MNLFEVMKVRKSVRSYKPQSVPEAELHAIIDAARSTPSAGNIQPWHFILIKDKEKRTQIARGCRYGRFLAESPVVIIGCGNKKASPRWYAIDTALAMEHIVLAATASGLGTCWIGSFNKEEIRSLLSIPDKFEIVALLAVGYPENKPDFLAKLLHFFRPKKKMKDILSLETYQNKPK